jgi:hypothetical protein
LTAEVFLAQILGYPVRDKMPEQKTSVTAERLREQSLALQRVIDDAQRLQREIAEHLVAVRRAGRANRRGQPYSGPERRKVPRS